MRRYESVWVVNGDLPDEEVKSTIDKFSRIISSQGGTLVGVEEWGRRKLSYRIQGTIRGFYVMADFAGSPEAVKELERNYRIDDRIIRYLTTKKSDHVNLDALQAEIAARAKAAAPHRPRQKPRPRGRGRREDSCQVESPDILRKNLPPAKEE